MDELTTDPVYIPNIDMVELSYNKRNSILSNDRAQLQEAAHLNLLDRWGQGVDTKNIISTSGTSKTTAHTSSVATGVRKSICKADVRKLMDCYWMQTMFQSRDATSCWCIHVCRPVSRPC